MTSSSLDFEEAAPANFEELRVRDCSIKRTLDVIGDKWTLLVIREARSCAWQLQVHRLAAVAADRRRAFQGPASDRSPHWLGLFDIRQVLVGIPW